MSALRNVPTVKKARRALQSRARAAWSTDRTRLPWRDALGNRALRMAVMVVRGIIAHRLELLAAALTYYTVFAIVPTLAVVLWILRAFDFLPAVPSELPAAPTIPTGNDLLAVALGRILEAVNRTSEVATGLLGLVVLLFAVSKMLRQTERTLHIIAASGRRAARLSRLFGYVVLLLMPPVALAISGLLFTILSGHLGAKVAHVLASIPGFELVLGAALGLGMVWLAVTIFYWSAVRARIPFRSAAVGGAVAAIALPVVFWVFAIFQIGVAQASTLGSGFLAVPVFLLWVFSSWSVVLVGAEVAVAHRADRTLPHGVAASHLDGVGEIQACVAIMVRLTRAARAASPGGPPPVTEDDLARTLRLPPHLVHALCLRLVDRSLLAEWPGGFTLRADPQRTTLATVIEAAQRDPALDAAHAEALAQLGPRARAAITAGRGAAQPDVDPGPTLAELAEEAPPTR